jgi:S1-C subfamily serine protease
MFSRIPHIARLAAVSALAAVILAPAASAGRYSIAAPPPQASQVAATCHQYCGFEHYRTGSLPAGSRSLLRTELVPASSGFDWTDAAIGFAIGIGAMVLVLAVGTGSRRLRPANSAS